MADSDPVPRDRVRGVGRLLIPYVGRVALIRQGDWAAAVEPVAMLAGAAVLVVLTEERAPGRHRYSRKVSYPGGRMTGC